MKHLKQAASLLLALALTAGLAACGGASTGDTGAESKQSTQQEAQAPEVSEPTDADTDAEPADLQVAALKGPTAMGLVKLMNAAETADLDLTPSNNYTFTIAAAADEITPKLIQGELDIACVPANLASVLYNKTQGQIEVLAVNTLGVLYLVDTGDTVHSIADLAGQTVVAAGKGSTPEYALRYLLTENGIDPDADLTIEWKSEHSECVTALATGEASIALLPQPFVTVAQSKLESLRVAVDLTEAWNALDNGSALLTGVVIARKAVVDADPAAIDAFLADYAASVAWVNENVADAAQLVGSYNIVDAAVAEKAIPYCNIVCQTGSELKENLSGYLSVLFDQNPESVGGALPNDDFYYEAE